MASENDTQAEDAKLWGLASEKILIDILVDEVNKGLTQNGLINTRRWAIILETLHTRSKRPYTIKQLKNKYNKLRTKYREFSSLISQTGFGWNPKRNTVTASAELWETYLRAHPRARAFQKKGCEHYKDLGIIFNNSTTTGLLCHASKQNPHMVDLEGDFITSGVHADVNSEDSTQPPKPQNEPQTEPRREKRKKRVKRSGLDKNDSYSNALNSWADNVGANAERYRRGNSVEGTSCGPPDYSIAKCMKLLKEMTGFDITQQLKACDAFRDPITRELFICMTAEMRRHWLLKL